MKNFIRHRSTWEYYLDLGDQLAQRCNECARRTWVERRPAELCPRCGGTLTEPRPERRQRWQAGFALKKDAEAAREAELRRLDQGGDPIPSDETISDYLRRWLADRIARKELRPRTAQRYEQLIANDIVPAIGGVRLVKVRAAEINSVMDAMAARGLSASSQKQARALMGRALQDAAGAGLISINVARVSRSPVGSRRKVTPPTAEQVRTLLQRAEGTPWVAPLTIAAFTGARRGEVLGLAWSDFDLPSEGRGSLAISRALQRPASGQPLELVEPKTENAHRRLSIPPALVAFLRRHRAEQRRRLLLIGSDREWATADLVCDRGDGGPLDPDGFTHAFKRIAKNAGLPSSLSLHGLRHAAATQLLEAGVEVKVASAMLGHSSSSFTADQYQHVLQKMTEAGADALGAAYGGNGSGHP
ncbi:MAG: tyrosine-type recombinase/integrase [Actinomycetota bacterium]